MVLAAPFLCHEDRGVPIKHRNVVCVYNVMAGTRLVWLLERIGLLFLPAPLHAGHLREKGGIVECLHRGHFGSLGQQQYER